MKMKKVLAMALALVLAMAVGVGATLAYLMDTDKAVNTFTVGNVAIELKEEFKQDSKLLPGIDVQKQIKVKNTGTEEAYVRIHMAIPSILDSGSEDKPEFTAYNNTLHWNFSGASVQEGQWSQLKNKEAKGPNANYPNWPDNGGAYNMYEATIDGVVYNVYVITYESALAAGATTTTNAIEKVYLDTSVTNEGLTEIIAALKGQIKIHVVAEGGHVAGFEGDAYTALNTQFGVPGSYDPFKKQSIYCNPLYSAPAGAGYIWMAQRDEPPIYAKSIKNKLR